MNQNTKHLTLKLALLAASLLSSRAVWAFPALPLALPPPASPDITVKDVSIEFTPGIIGSSSGSLSVTRQDTGGFSLDGDPLLSNSTYCYNNENVKTDCYSLIVETNPNNHNALLSGTLQILGGTDGKTTLLKGNITAFGVDDVGGGFVAFDFLLNVTQSLYNYGPIAAVVLGSWDLTGLSDTDAFSGTGNVDNYNLVPEPASLVLFAVGGMVLFASKRRHRLDSMI